MKEKNKRLIRESVSKTSLYTIAAVLISAACWYYANSLSGNFGLLMWVAPVGVLLISLNASAKSSFYAAFAAYFIGRLSWFYYLVAIISIVPTLLFMFAFSVIFGLIIVVNRGIMLSTNVWPAVFSFPALVTSFEFLLLKFAPDGTAGSSAYSQMNFLPVIQIAAATGILGITFLLALFPSGVAMAWQFRKDKRKLLPVTVITGFIISAALLFGMMRLAKATNRETIKVGLIVLNEKYHDVTDYPDISRERLAAKYYADEITSLAVQGAKMVVLPERAININKESQAAILSLLCNTARQNRVFVILGYTNFTTDTSKNSALVINDSGSIAVQYDKVHLIKVLEDQFKPGKTAGLYKFNHSSAGIAVCKDLDFPDYIRRYNQIALMAVPAWDFSVDGWLHSRMAILRAVENGFAEIRTARQGRLTINDCFGRVITEGDCSDGNAVKLLGAVPLQMQNTFYARFGDWFGILNLAGVALFLFLFAKGIYLNKPSRR